MISSVSCIKFVPRTNQNDYVKISRGQGCSSLVNNQLITHLSILVNLKWDKIFFKFKVGVKGGAQTLTLGSGCVDAVVVAHEFMHALGFYHEQNRPVDII